MSIRATTSMQEFPMTIWAANMRCATTSCCRWTKPGGPVTAHPVALKVEDVPWAEKQMWAPDAAFKKGTYYLYFPARDRKGVFRIGVATSKSPAGPFKAERKPIKGSFSIDPAVFVDDDGKAYMYFGGIWGGQLQRWATGKFNAKGSDTDLGKDDKPALCAKVARLTADMKEFAHGARDVVILDEGGKPVLGGDHDKRFFEASWLFKRGRKYYFTYSTGDTHYLAYAIGDNPYGPFRFKGHFLEPVQGWTTHHSVVKFKRKWWLFYHDVQLSDKNHLRSVKMTELNFNRRWDDPDDRSVHGLGREWGDRIFPLFSLGLGTRTAISEVRPRG